RLSARRWPDAAAMRDLPFFRHFVARWQHHTEHLTATERGAYIDLLGRYWTDGTLPVDEAKLARYAHCTHEEWALAEPAVVAMFERDGDRLVDNWLDEERERSETFIALQAEKGRLSGAARRRNRGSATAQQRIDRGSTGDEPTYTDTEQD